MLNVSCHKYVGLLMLIYATLTIVKISTKSIFFGIFQYLKNILTRFFLKLKLKLSLSLKLKLKPYLGTLDEIPLF